MISIDDSLSQNSSQSDSEIETPVKFMLIENEHYEKNPFLTKLSGGKIKCIRPLGCQPQSFESYIIEMSEQTTYFCICYVDGYSSIAHKLPSQLTCYLPPDYYKEKVRTQRRSFTYELYELDQFTTPIHKLTTSEAYWFTSQLQEKLEELNTHQLYTAYLTPCLFLRRGGRLVYCGRGCLYQKKGMKESLRMQSSKDQLQLKEVAKLLQYWLNGRGNQRIRIMIQMALDEKTKPKHFFKSVNAEIENLTQELWTHRLQRGVTDSFILPTLLALDQFKLELSAPQSVEKMHTLLLVSGQAKSQLRQIILALVTGIMGQAIITNDFYGLSQKFYFQLKCLKHSAKQINENVILAFFRNIQKIITTEKNTEKAIKSCLMRLSVDSHFTNAACDLFELYAQRDGTRLHQKIRDLVEFTESAFGYYFDIEKHSSQQNVKAKKWEAKELRIVKIKDKQQFGVILPSFWRFVCSELIYFYEVEGHENPCDLTLLLDWDDTSFKLDDGECSFTKQDNKEQDKEATSPKRKLKKGLFGRSYIESSTSNIPKAMVRKSSKRWDEMFKSHEEDSIKKMKQNVHESQLIFNRHAKSRILPESAKSVRPPRRDEH